MKTQTCPCGIVKEDCTYHKDRPLIYDVSGSVYVAGETNFHAENVYDALAYANMADCCDSGGKIIMPLTVYLKQWWYNMIDDPSTCETEPGTYQSMAIQIKDSDLAFKTVCETEVISKKGLSVTIRTREF